MEASHDQTVKELKTTHEKNVGKAASDVKEDHEQLYEQLKASTDKKNKEMEQAADESAATLEKLQSKYDILNEEKNKLEEAEKQLKDKLHQVHSDMSDKVESGHDNVKKIVDVHKTNEELSSQLLAKVEQCKELEKLLAEQKVAYEVLLESVSKAETGEANLKEEKEELANQLRALNDMKQ